MSFIMVDRTLRWAHHSSHRPPLHKGFCSCSTKAVWALSCPYPQCWQNWGPPWAGATLSESLLASLTETPHLLFSTSMLLVCPRQKHWQAFEFGCADGSGQGSRKGSHVYEINTLLWNFGRPQPRIGGLSVSKTERIRRQSRSETSRRAGDQIWQTYIWYLPVICTHSVKRTFGGFMSCLPPWHLYVHADTKLW